MKVEKLFKTLTAQARAEIPPTVNVAESVLDILTSMQTEPVAVLERPWKWLAALSSAVAGAMAVITIVIYYTFSEPLVEITNAISWVAQ
jgi:hypothetical protein